MADLRQKWRRTGNSRSWLQSCYNVLTIQLAAFLPNFDTRWTPLTCHVVYSSITLNSQPSEAIRSAYNFKVAAMFNRDNLFSSRPNPARQSPQPPGIPQQQNYSRVQPGGQRPPQYGGYEAAMPDYGRPMRSPQPPQRSQQGATMHLRPEKNHGGNAYAFANLGKRYNRNLDMHIFTHVQSLFPIVTSPTVETTISSSIANLL